MSDCSSPPPIDHTGATCALRKVAVLAHWVPGVGAVISQDGRVPVRVATWLEASEAPVVELDPCSFRRGLSMWLDGDEHGLAHLVEPDDGVVIRVTTDEHTKISEHGIVLHRMTASSAVVAFATLVEPEGCHHPGCLSSTEAVDEVEPMLRVDVERDDELGVSLLHTTVDPTDVVALNRAHDVMLELLITYSAIETVEQFEAMSGR